MRSIHRITLMTLLITSSLALAQQPPAKPEPAVQPKAPYDSTKAQLAWEREKNFQLQANQMQQQLQKSMQELQAKYAGEEKQIVDWVAQVRKDNGWDESYTYDREQDKWTHAEKAKK
ncbi:MAG: hypothetical protein WB608_16165 [Terracidiphilus sp.]